MRGNIATHELLTALMVLAQCPPAWAGESPTVDTTQSSTGSTVDSKSLHNLPLNGRNFADLVKLAPGVAANKASPSDSVNWSNVPMPDDVANAAIQEFSTNTQGLAPAYGSNAAGGVVNALTKSGANEFHGSTLTLNKNIAPRAGLIWDPFKDGRTKVYGNFGVNYESVPLDLGMRSLSMSREWPGEAAGVNGMVIGTGTSRGNQRAAVVYDWDGYPLAVYTADDLKNHPQEVVADLNNNCRIINSGKVTVSGKTTSGKLSTSGGGLSYPISDTAGQQGGAGQTTEKKKDKSTVTDEDVKNGLDKLTPEQRAALDRMGLTPQQPTTPPQTPPQGSGDKASGGSSAPSIVDDLSKSENSLPLHPNPTGEPNIVDNPDGSTTRTWPDGTKEVTRPDGSQQVDYPDGHKFTRGPDGSTVDKNPDGSTVSRDANGKETGRTPATNPTTPSTPQTTPQSGTQPTQPSTTTPKSSSKNKGTVTDEDVEKGLKKNKAAADAAKKYGLQKGGGAEPTPSTTPKDTTPPKSDTAPKPESGAKPATPQGQPKTGTTAPDALKTQSLAPKTDDGWAVPPTPGVPFSGVPKLRDTAPPGSNPQAILHPNDFGADLGGPIVKDKLWFWGSGNRNAIEQRQTETNAFYRSGGTTRLGHQPFALPQGWAPQLVGVLPYGCSSRTKAALLDDIRTALDGRIPSHSNAYLWEPVFNRSIQGKHEPPVALPIPNDPLYDKGEDARRRAAVEREQGRGAAGPDLSMAAPPGGPGGRSRIAEVGPSQRKKKPEAIDQWGLRAVGFTPPSQPDSAWRGMDWTTPNVTVAIIDSGLDTAHPDGPQFLWTNPRETPGNGLDDDHDGYVDDVHGWNFLEENNDLTDFAGHGTLVAGIIAAKANNGIGIAGINPGAQIMVLKVADRLGRANSLNIYRAIHYAVDHGARVINLSLGERGVSKLEQLAVNYAHARGAVVVVAAGNQGSDLSQYGPGAARRTLPVAALNMKHERSGISNFGANLALIAPGEQIYSLHSKDAEWPGSPLDRERLYRAATGTSFSAPIVTGTVSLLFAKHPELSNLEAESILESTATDVGAAGWDASTGAGLLNASKALGVVPQDLLIVEPTEIVVNSEKKAVSSVDVFGIIRGAIASYQVELGKGKQPKDWLPVSTTQTKWLEYGLICHIDGQAFAKGKEWTLRITVTDAKGQTKTAQVPLTI